MTLDSQKMFFFFLFFFFLFLFISEATDGFIFNSILFSLSFSLSPSPWTSDAKDTNCMQSIDARLQDFSSVFEKKKTKLCLDVSMNNSGVYVHTKAAANPCV
ncbi:hypothetical protein CSUI_006076 [Cystoisospora suis]|uniref:Uncharacterized protein n=1 Tax=Cystoisospora suis TaxID=483139 RepID=A0A2C6KVC4_9APIC|nr:hypothetical protein CSUI_006076 [Cystoisospora suis]